MKTLSEVDVANKRVLVRADLNVPVADSAVTSDMRLQAALPTIQQLLAANAKVMLMSHLGRPKEGADSEEYSLRPVAERLSELLGAPVRLQKNWIDGVELSDGEVVLCENVRYLSGEKDNSDQLAKKMAALCDVFVMDAFATAHRAHASTTGVAEYASIACAGPLLTAELNALGHALAHAKKPLAAIVGGSKVSTKLQVLHSLVEIADILIVGGGIANTLIAAAGHNVGQSLVEPDFIDQAAELMATAQARGVKLPLPVDVVVANEFSASAIATVKRIDEVTDNEMILDVGPETSAIFASLLTGSATILWNGPVGVFEFDQFGEGTKTLAQAIAASAGFTVAGGGDTIAAAEKNNVIDQLSYVSTGGGAFLEFLEGKTLPGVAVLG